jgi:hypothetical protein
MSIRFKKSASLQVKFTSYIVTQKGFVCQENFTDKAMLHKIRVDTKNSMFKDAQSWAKIGIQEK